MKQVLGLALVMTTALATAALAAPEHIRGTVSAVSGDSVTVHTQDGKDQVIALDANTHYLKVVKSSLDQVEQGAFVGTATKDVDQKHIALEVVVFPPSMKGVGEGHHPWDRIADTTASGSGATDSSMTNGTIAAVQPGAAMAETSMTNGTIATAHGKSDAKEIVVRYKGGEQTVIVPSTAPVVTVQPDEKGDLGQGKAVFVIATGAGNALKAAAVAIGTPGAPPPM